MLQRVVTLLLILGALGSSVIFAQDRGSIITDRPDFTESPFSVAPGTIQLEFGGTWTDFAGFTTISGPELLGRIGVFKRVELRVTAPNYIEEKNATGNKTSGFTDMTLGAKFQISDENSVVGLAVIGQASIPTGDEDELPTELAAGRLQPEIIAIVGTDVSPGVSIGGLVGLKSIQEVGENKLRFMATFVLSGEVASKLSAFGEFFFNRRPSFSTYVAHTGLLYAISDSFQIDFHGGTGMNDASGNLFLGAGAAIRL